MKIKICGITRVEDARCAVELGATHIGCVMVPDSPRYAPPDQAREIFTAVKEAEHVLVFRSQPAEVVLETARQVGVKTVQLHHYKEADAKALEEKGLTVIRVFDVPTGSNMLPNMVPAPSPERLSMLDVAGGTSDITFPWEILGSEAPPSTFISGGVRPENVCALVTHRPYGIDISSGVEMSPGLKDPDRITLLFDTLERGFTAL